MLSIYGKERARAAAAGREQARQRASNRVLAPGKLGLGHRCSCQGELKVAISTASAAPGTTSRTVRGARKHGARSSDRELDREHQVTCCPRAAASGPAGEAVV